MARTTTPAAAAALSAVITRPISLVEIGLSPVVRMSSHGDVTWRGESWSGGERVRVSGLGADGSGAQSGRLEIGNEDLLFGALLLNQGGTDRPVKIWAGDAAALGDDDLMLVFDGVIAAFQVTVDAVLIELAAQGARALFSPRRFVGPSAGFNVLLPAGTIMKVGSTTYTLERA